MQLDALMEYLTTQFSAASDVMPLSGVRAFADGIEPKETELPATDASSGTPFSAFEILDFKAFIDLMADDTSARTAWFIVCFSITR
jgi:hypothetical protein